MGVGFIIGDRGLNLLKRGMINVVMANLQRGGGIAATHAGCAQNPNLGRVKPVFKRFLEGLAASQFTCQRIAYTDGQRRRWVFAFANHGEMRVKGCNFINLSLGQFHLMGQRMQMRHRKVADLVLNEMKVFYKEITAQRTVPDDGADFTDRAFINLTALGGFAPLAQTVFPYALI